MVAFHQLLIPLITLDNLIEFKRLHMKDQCAIFCGQIQMRKMDGVSHKEEQDIPLEVIFQSSLYIIIS